jgi:hypothetical protein
VSELKKAIHDMHHCDAEHIETIPVTETFQGQTVWDGKVEVFSLIGHPQAKKCYAWQHDEGKDDKGSRFITVLELPPVDSARSAVQAAIVSEAKAK